MVAKVFSVVTKVWPGVVAMLSKVLGKVFLNVCYGVAKWLLQYPR